MTDHDPTESIGATIDRLTALGYAGPLATADSTEIRFPWPIVAMASDWHGGQSSMLYALASTGALRCGRGHDAETLAYCADALAGEFVDIMNDHHATDTEKSNAETGRWVAMWAAAALAPDTYGPMDETDRWSLLVTIAEETADGSDAWDSIR